MQEVQAHEDHAGHPEVEDVAGSIEHLRRIEAAQVFSVGGPPERDEGPER